MQTWFLVAYVPVFVAMTLAWVELRRAYRYLRDPKGWRGDDKYGDLLRPGLFLDAGQIHRTRGLFYFALGVAIFVLVTGLLILLGD